MSSAVTDLPLHEVVLKIMFHENTEKAVPMTPADVLWKIDNPEISERQIREVLDWLVRQKKVELYLGKYSIDRIEFLEQKELYQASLKTNGRKSNPKKRVHKKETLETFYLSPPKTKKTKYEHVILGVLIVLIGYLSYTLLELKYSFSPNQNLEKEVNKVVKTIPKQKLLYLSKDNLYTKNEKKAISYSFSRQNKINEENVKELNRIQIIVDSIANHQNLELLKLQKELQANFAQTNSFIQKVFLSNVIVILIFAFLIYLLYKYS